MKNNQHTLDLQGTFSQMYVHVVFSVKQRASLIHPEWEERLYQYITGIVREKNQKMLAINGMPDHLHFLIGMKPVCCLSDLVREVKKSSNQFINENRFAKFNFNWQEGYGAFTYNHSQLIAIINYIMNQKEHHKHITFQDEYIRLLKDNNLDHLLR